MKYLIMVYTNPHMRSFWETASDEERTEGAQGHASVMRALTEAGELIASASLDDQSLTKRVALVDGRASTTDGPFAEVKEHLAGFYFIECSSEERALEWAAQMPEADFGMVEVRPIRDLSAYGL
ncbi:YciI family protein [Lentzea tibetensis]|uniref:YciI family protein n=1 Tax=Lentzea tibetensis TaxID=2591470 RepID=UPI001C996DFE|nr:YciI family protein [Lentzea tibetensis]